MVQRRRSSTDDESLPEPPARLSESSRALWRAVISAHRFWPRSRMAVLESALLALDDAEAAHAQVQAEGTVIRTSSTGVTHLNPRVKVERDARALFVRIFDQLGLTR